MSSTVSELWRHRSLIRALVRSHLKAQPQHSLLGYAWWLLDPILMTLTYTLLITFVLGRTRTDVPYPVFLLCGLIAWKSFASTLIQSTGLIAKHDSLVTSYRFPRAAIPVSLVLANQITFAVALLPLLALIAIYQCWFADGQIHLGGAVAYVPIIAGVQLSITLGASLLLACIGVFFQDLASLMGHVLRVSWYLSPGLYSIADVITGYRGVASLDAYNLRSLYALNPLAHVIESYRQALLFNRTPDVLGLVLALAFGAALLVAGLALFRSQERKFAKLV